MTKTESLANLAQSIDYGLTASAVKSSAGPRFLRITDIQDGLVNWGSVPSCNCTPEDLQRFPLAVGDIVFARTGATTGKSFLIRELPNDPVVFASYLIRVRPKGVDPKFLAHFFNSAEYWRQITRGANGSTQPGVNATTLGELRVPAPPINEQKRIAAILDKADAIRRKREQAIQLADEFLRSLFLDMFGDPVVNQRDWPLYPLRDVLCRIESGWSPTCADRRAEPGEWAVLKLGAVTSCVFKPNENKAILPATVPRREIEVHDGDVLFARKNTYELVAACALVMAPPPRLMMSDLIFRLKIKEPRVVLPEYLWQALVQPSLRSQIQKLAGGSAGSMPNISKERLMTAKLPVPPLELQTLFVTRLQKFRTLAGALTEQRLLAERADLALRAQVFSGQL